MKTLIVGCLAAAAVMLSAIVALSFGSALTFSLDGNIVGAIMMAAMGGLTLILDIKIVRVGTEIAIEKER